METFKVTGTFSLDQYRQGEKINSYSLKNAVVKVSKDHVLDILFKDASQFPNWYLGLIDTTGFSILSADDTMLSHAGWNEFTNYSELTRPEWDPDAPSNQAITNSVVRSFTISAVGTIKGTFLCSEPTKNGNSGLLFATALYEEDIEVAINDDLKLTYTVTSE